MFDHNRKTIYEQNKTVILFALDVHTGRNYPDCLLGRL